jgi:hypothetical protein
MTRSILIAALLFAPALSAQTTQTLPFSAIRTPEIQLGSGSTPTTVTEPSVVELPPVPIEMRVSDSSPASTTLLAARHFEFINSPLNKVTPGSMADTSISLGDYARNLRTRRQLAAARAPATRTTPNAMAAPARSK